MVNISAGAQLNDKPVLRIGLIADPQYADIETVGVRYFRETVGKLTQALDTLKQEKVDFIVNLGDMVDRHYKSYDTIIQLYKNYSVPFYNVLGNHDFEIEDEYKPHVINRYGMPDYYYDFSIDNWRFIFLDGTELGVYSSYIHPELAPESESLRKSVTGQINDRPWNGGISKKQQKWLREKLINADSLDQKVLIFCHFPVLPESIDLTLWNSNEIVSILEEFPNIVAYISGHYHEGGYMYKSGIHYVIQKAMSDTHENAFAILDVYPGEIRIKGYGNICDTILSIHKTR